MSTQTVALQTYTLVNHAMNVNGFIEWSLVYSVYIMFNNVILTYLSSLCVDSSVFIRYQSKQERNGLWCTIFNTNKTLPVYPNLCPRLVQTIKAKHRWPVEINQMFVSSETEIKHYSHHTRGTNWCGSFLILMTFWLQTYQLWMYNTWMESIKAKSSC